MISLTVLKICSISRRQDGILLDWQLCTIHTAQGISCHGHLPTGECEHAHPPSISHPPPAPLYASWRTLPTWLRKAHARFPQSCTCTRLCQPENTLRLAQNGACPVPAELRISLSVPGECPQPAQKAACTVPAMYALFAANQRVYPASYEEPMYVMMS